MNKIAFLGLGAMGTRMAQKLIDAGLDVVVWNRSEEATLHFTKQGVSVASNPRHAVEGADYVVSMVRDDDASRSVWLDKENGALGGMKEQAIALECSTLSLNWVKELETAFTNKKRHLVDVPLAGSRPQAEAAQLIFFAGGTDQNVESVKPLLQYMGSAVHHVGKTGAGTMVKLMVNSLFGSQLAVMAELIALVDQTSFDVNRALDALSQTPVCSMEAKLSAQAMVSGMFNPQFPIELVAKDFDCLQQTAEKIGASLNVVTQVGETFRQCVNKGFGKDNITGIIQLYQ